MKRNTVATQGACLTVALMKKAMTYGDMLSLGISTCPHKRVQEYLRITPGLALVKTQKKVGDHKLTAWRVVKQ